MDEQRAREIMSKVRLCQGKNPGMDRLKAAQACGISDQEYREACSYWGNHNGCKRARGNSDAPQTGPADQLDYTLWLVNNVTLDDWAKAHGAKIARQDTPTENRYLVIYPKSEREILAAKLEAARAEIRKLSKQIAALS